MMKYKNIIDKMKMINKHTDNIISINFTDDDKIDMILNGDRYIVDENQFNNIIKEYYDKAVSIKKFLNE